MKMIKENNLGVKEMDGGKCCCGCTDERDQKFRKLLKYKDKVL